MSLEELNEELLVLLQNSQIDDETVRTCVDTDFVGRLEGPEIDFDGVENHWERVIELLTKVVHDDNSDDVISRLETQDMLLKKIVTVLAFGMEKHKDKTGESCVISLLAARMYLLLACLNSAHVYGIVYKANITRTFTAIRTAYQKKLLHDDVRPKSKKSGKSKKNATGDISSLPPTQDTEVELFTSEVVESLSHSLFRCLEQFYVFLRHEIARDYIPQIADHIKLLCRFDYGSSTHVLPAATLSEFKKIKLFSSRCFALAHLASSERFNFEDVVLAKFCLPRLIFKSFDGQFLRGPLPQSMLQVANTMIQFLKTRFAGEPDSSRIFLKRIAENVVHHCLAERIDYRQSSITVALQLIEDLSKPLIHQFFYFAVNYSHLPTQRHKLIAVDLICSILDKFDVASFPTGLLLTTDVDYELYHIFDALEFNDEDFNDRCPGATKHWKQFGFFTGDNKFNARDAMMKTLVRSTMDKVSAVRGRALNGVLNFVKDAEGYKELTKHARHFIVDKRKKVVQILSEVNVHDEQMDGKETPNPSQRPETPVPSQIQEGAQKEAGFLTRVSGAPFVDLIVQRCNDKSVVTRKFTIPIIERLLDLEPNPKYQKLLLERLQDFCRDPSVQVRKLGASAMTNILRDEEIYKRAWLHTVLPMLSDREDSVEKSCREMFFKKIVDPIVANDGTDSLSWNMIIEITKSSSFKRAFRKCFYLVCQDSEHKIVLRQLVKILYGAVKQQAVAKSAWMLLDYLADAMDIDVTPAINAWFCSDETFADKDPNIRVVTDPLELLSILSIIYKRRKSIEGEIFEQLRDNIGYRLVTFQLPGQVISDAVLTFVGLLNGDNNEDNFKGIQEFMADVVKKCYDELITAPEEEQKYPEKKRRDVIARRLLTMGQAAMHAPYAINEDILKLLVHILSAEAPLLDNDRATALSRPGTRMGSQPMKEPEVRTLVQNLPFSQLQTEITAAAVIALGKMILANPDIRREYLKKIILVYGSSDHAPVRNNAIYVLADCYFKYTCEMDPLQKAFLHGLRDRVDFVRYHALLLTTELLRSQYMKLSALVVARLLPLLLDKDAIIRDALEKETLAVIEDQFPSVYIENFVTVMFLINRVPYGSYSDMKDLEMPGNPICFLNHNLSGALKRKERMTIYKFMLKKFDDSQKFMLINYISKSIFDGIVSGKVCFEMPEVKQLLLDGFQVIELPEAKLQLDEGVREDDDEGDLPPEELQKMAKKTIRVMFCHAFVQEIMPKFMDMSRFLARIKSPLQKEFRNCLSVIAEAYPDELHLLFRDSAQLKLEIEADLKLRKREARKSRMQRNKALVDNMAQDGQEKENIEPGVGVVKIEPNDVEEVAVQSEAQNMNEKDQNDEPMVVETAVSAPEVIGKEVEENSPEVEIEKEIKENSPAVEIEKEVDGIPPEVGKEVEENLPETGVQKDAPEDGIMEENGKTIVVEKEEVQSEGEKGQESRKIEEVQESTLKLDENPKILESPFVHTAIEPSTPSEKGGSSNPSTPVTPSTPVGPPKKRRKSEISIHLLQSMRRDKSVRLASMAHLDVVEPNLSPRVIAATSIKRIHSTPKKTDDGFFDFTFGGDFSMIVPVDQSRITTGKKRAR